MKKNRIVKTVKVLVLIQMKMSMKV